MEDGNNYVELETPKQEVSILDKCIFWGLALLTIGAYIAFLFMLSLWIVFCVMQPINYKLVLLFIIALMMFASTLCLLITVVSYTISTAKYLFVEKNVNPELTI